MTRREQFDELLAAALNSDADAAHPDDLGARYRALYGRLASDDEIAQWIKVARAMMLGLMTGHSVPVPHVVVRCVNDKLHLEIEKGTLRPLRDLLAMVLPVARPYRVPPIAFCRTCHRAFVRKGRTRYCTDRCKGTHPERRTYMRTLMRTRRLEAAVRSRDCD